MSNRILKPTGSEPNHFSLMRFMQDESHQAVVGEIPGHSNSQGGWLLVLPHSFQEPSSLQGLKWFYFHSLCYLSGSFSPLIDLHDHT